MTEKTKYIIRRVAKLALTSPIWAFLLILGGISWIIGVIGSIIRGIGRSLESFSRKLDDILMKTFATPGGWCDKVVDWVNK